MITVKATRNASTINIFKLRSEAVAAFGAAYLDANETDYGATVAVYLTDHVANEQNIWNSVVAAHDPNQLTPEQQKALSDGASVADVQARWQASALHNKTPAQIFTAMQGQIDSWTTLAQAKADLRVWIPLLFAGIAWTVFKDQQRD